MNAKLLQPYFLITCIAIATGVAALIFRPFLVDLLLAGVFAVVLDPLYRSVLRRVPKLPSLAALVTISITVIGILVPLAFVTLEITGGAQQLYTSLSDGSTKTHFDTLFQYATNTINQYAPGLVPPGVHLSSSADQYVKTALAWLVQNLGGAFGSVMQLLFDLFIFSFALYYLLRDGAKLVRCIVEFSPLTDFDDKVIFSRLAQAINAVIRGSLAIALIQGILTAVGFTLFGVPNGVLWGVVAAFAALIPGIGNALILFPGVLYLFVIGATVPGIGLLIWSSIAVGVIANVVGPRLVGKGMQLHPLVVLLSVFGGLTSFGPAGIFLGPLATSLLFALLSIYPRVEARAQEG